VTEDRAPAQHRIVAGVDGSQPSRAALAWAVRQAELTGGTVDAVTAWELPATSGLDPQLYLDYPEAAAKMLAAAIAETGGSAVAQPKVVAGHPAEVLVTLSDGADLLVVGNQGHGGLMGTLLGSVSLHCLQHAHCPVALVRTPLG
jgi:nucleotide-binding universal stress UspA family protein